MTILMEEILLGTASFESTDVEFEYEVYLHNPDLEYIASNSPHKVLQEQYGIYVPKSDKNASTGLHELVRSCSWWITKLITK